MSPDCGACGKPFKTGDQAIPLRPGQAIHAACATKAVVVKPTASAPPIIAHERPSGLNKLEQRYHDHLQAELRAGLIRRFDVHPEKLRLADQTYYIPDFRVVHLDGVISFDETKGFMRDDAAVKIKVAAELHPYRFRLVRWVKNAWDIQEVGQRTR